MKKNQKHHKRNLKGTFMAVPHHVWDSDAMTDCNSNARVVLLQLLRRYNGFNNGKISLSVREAAIGASVCIGTASTSLKRLEEVGLIITTRQSGFNMKNRMAREFEITFHPVDNHVPKNTFKNWRKNNSISGDTLSSF